MTELSKWGGLATNASPYAIPAGTSVVQTNIQCISPGKIEVRPGTTALTFSVHSGGSDPVVCAYRYPGVDERIIYENSSGELYVAKGPS